MFIDDGVDKYELKSSKQVMDEVIHSIECRILATPKEDFYLSDAWRKVRYQVLLKNKAKCMCCGTSGEFVQLHVDHIKPRSTHPQLELDEANLKFFCVDCNLGKSNIDDTDWRPRIRPYLDHDKLKAFLRRVEDEKNGIYTYNLTN